VLDDKQNSLPDMNGQTPLITIGMTCFNAADTIARAVDSALGQTWPNIEILVVDDFSTDGSRYALEQIALEHSQVRLIRHECNRGFPAALNTIIHHAKGDFIAFFDDDDESVPERLKEQFDRIVSYERACAASLVLCYSSRNVVRIGESEVNHIARPVGCHAPEPYGPVVADYILGVPVKNSFCWGTGIFGSCTLMARRSVFLKVGAFDVSFRRTAEMDFAIRSALAGAHFISVDCPLITQYKTFSDDKSVEINFRYRLQLIRKFKAYLSKRRLYWAAIALLRKNFHETQGNVIMALAWTLSALCCFPLRFSFYRLSEKIESVTNAKVAARPFGNC
jgi:glycosyltransferase involved in cell wall biosynthesis